MLHGKLLQIQTFSLSFLLLVIFVKLHLNIYVKLHEDDTREAQLI